MVLTVLILTLLLRLGTTQIIASSDLNCDFASPCRWRNGTTGSEDGGDWLLSDDLQMDDFHKISPLSGTPGDIFAYTQAFGRQRALLISDVVSCQLGGASIKFWYWKTGQNVELDVCIRQPPGNPDSAALRCYNALTATHAQTWIPRAIELPPVSQPFELVFRGTFTPPLDILGLDSIVYDAILCGGEGEEAKRWRRTIIRSRRSPPIIGLRDWQRLKESPNMYSGRQPTMLVLSAADDDENFGSITQKSSTSLPFATTATSIVKNTTEEATSSTTEEPSTSSSTGSTTTMEPEVTVTAVVKLNKTDSSTASPEEHAQNMMRFLRGVAPILPFVPALVRTLQSVDPRIQAATGRDPLTELAGVASVAGVDLTSLAAAVKVVPTEFPVQTIGGLSPIQPVVQGVVTATANPPLDPNLAQLARKFGLLESVGREGRSFPLPSEGGSGEWATTTTTTMSPSFITEAPGLSPPPSPNLFGLDRVRNPEGSSIDDSSTVYPPQRIKAFTTQPRVDQNFVAPPGIPPSLTLGNEDEPIDWSLLSDDEIQKLVDIHRKIFQLEKRKPGAKKPQRSLPKGERTNELIVYDKNKKKTVKPITEVPPVKSSPLPQPATTTSFQTFAQRLGDITKFLPPGAINDLQALREIPNLEELTAGMDLSLLNQPGGFASLKQEFIRRYVNRSMGLAPPMSPRSPLPPLPPPIVPVKVSRKMLKQMLAKQRRKV